MDVSIYLVGHDPSDALDCLPFDCYESAENYAFDNRDADGSPQHIYCATATIDENSLELV